MQIDRQTSFARGMNDAAAPMEYRPDEVELLLNARVSFDGQSIERRDGSRKTHDAALNSSAQCYGGIEFVTTGGTQQLVAFFGDTMYTSTDEGATWTSQATGLDTDEWSLVIMREGSTNVLCAANGGTNAYQWDGTTWSTITGIPSGVKYLAVWNDRLAAAGHDGVQIAVSKVGDIDKWALSDGGFTLRFATHDGDTDITGIYPIGTVMLVWKRSSMGFTEGFGFSTVEVEAGARGISRSVGCVASRTIKPCGDQGVMWLSERGLEYYEPGGRVTLVTRAVQGLMDGVSWNTIISNPEGPTALWWPRRHEYWCALPFSTSGGNDSLIVFRPPVEDQPPSIWTYKHVSDEDGTLYVDSGGYLELSTDADRAQGDADADGYLTTTATGGQHLYVDANGYLDFAATISDHATLWTADIGSMTSHPLSGGYNGFVRELETGDKDDQDRTDPSTGDAITMHLISRPFVFGDEMRTQKAKRIRVATKQEAVATATIKVLADGAPQTAHTHTLTVTADDRPKTIKSRVGSRGFAHSVEVVTTGKVKLTALELAAQLLAEPS